MNGTVRANLTTGNQYGDMSLMTEAGTVRVPLYLHFPPAERLDSRVSLQTLPPPHRRPHQPAPRGLFPQDIGHLVNNAAEHIISNECEEEGASAPVHFMSHRHGCALDIAVTADSYPTVRTALERTPGIHVESDFHALRLAVQELVSGTGVPTCGTGLRMTFTEMWAADPQPLSDAWCRSLAARH